MNASIPVSMPRVESLHKFLHHCIVALARKLHFSQGLRLTTRTSTRTKVRTGIKKVKGKFDGVPSQHVTIAIAAEGKLMRTQSKWPQTTRECSKRLSVCACRKLKLCGARRAALIYVSCRLKQLRRLAEIPETLEIL